MQWNGNESESPWVCFVGVKLSCYCKQTGRSAYKGLHELKNKVATYEVMVGGDFTGHDGCDVGGFGEVDWDFWIGQVNDRAQTDGLGRW